MQKGKSPRPPIDPTPEYIEKFISSRPTERVKGILPANKEKKAFEYLSAILEALVMVYEQMKVPESLVNAPTTMKRYTPQQMYDNSLIYLRKTIEARQPLTICGLALFMGIRRPDFFELLHEKKIIKDNPFMQFMYDFASFIEMYNEYAAHVKQNPAGPIFVLKNFGWTDRLELMATSVPGALSEEERALAKKRILES